MEGVWWEPKLSHAGQIGRGGEIMHFSFSRTNQKRTFPPVLVVPLNKKKKKGKDNKLFTFSLLTKTLCLSQIKKINAHDGRSLSTSWYGH